MKIAQIGPLMESVPPRGYGGTERIVSYLTEELVRLGHDVTLFASGDSVTSARLVSCATTALRLIHMYVIQFPIICSCWMSPRKRGRLRYIALPYRSIPFSLFRPTAGRTLTTLHGRQDLPDLRPLYFGFSEMPLVSISNSQRAPIRNANCCRNIMACLSICYIRHFRAAESCFSRHISPEGVDRAIAVARTLGIPLKIAAKVDRVDDVFFHEKIAPLLDNPGVEFIGEINDQEKTEFLGHALALMFLIDWPEPFGLSMIEAMACGTPVLAFRRGSVEEVVDHRTAGYIVDTVEDAILTMPAGYVSRSSRGAPKVRREVHQCSHGKRLCARTTNR